MKLVSLKSHECVWGRGSGSGVSTNELLQRGNNSSNINPQGMGYDGGS